MLEIDIYNHLTADITLTGLLGATAMDKKLYPIQASQSSIIPFIVYEMSSPAVSYTDIIEMETEQFNIFSDSYITCGNIADQLKKLLCISDELRVGGSTSIASSTYYIYCGTISGSSEFKDPDTNLFCRVISFSFRYKRKI